MKKAVPILPFCPRCGGSLSHRDASKVRCAACGQTYPKTLDILDLRLPDAVPPSESKDKSIANVLLKAYDRMSFSELAALFHKLRPASETRDMLGHYTRYFVDQTERSRKMLDMFARRLDEFFPGGGRTAALDVGCGSGASLTVLAERFEIATGVDPLLSNLLLARKALGTRNIRNVQLIQGIGQTVPYPDGSFDYVNLQNVIEHVFDADRVVRESVRLLADGGRFAADSRNRYDPFLPEPHVKLHWVGFLPRKWQQPYVWRRKNLVYDHTRLWSYREINLVFKKHFGRNYRIVFPLVGAYGQSLRAEKWVIRMERAPLIGRLALRMFPSHLVLAQKGADAPRKSECSGRS
jgi:SAM-dependent methyltransferase/ribosomal protein S27AE